MTLPDPGFLADTSALERTARPAVRARLDQIGPDRLHICAPVLLEVGYSALNAEDHQRRIRAYTLSMTWVHLTPRAERRALQVQGLLAARNHHRAARLADLLIAAVAEEHGLTVLHYDSDYDLIAEETGQPCEWVVPRGTVP